MADRDVRNDQNNAKNIQNAADVAIASKHPVAAAAGGAVKVADKATGGKVSKELGKKMSDINRHSPMGSRMQNASNRLAESGVSDKIGSVARMKGQKGSDLAKEPTKNNAMNDIGRGQTPSSTSNEFDNKNSNEIAGIGPFGKKKSSDLDSSNNQNENKEDTENIFGSKKTMKVVVSILLPIVLFAGTIIISIVILVAILENYFGDSILTAQFSDEDTGYANILDPDSIEAENFYMRINSVKLSLLSQGKSFDASTIVAVYKVLSGYNNNIEYDDFSESEIRKIANAMFNGNEYDEEYFKENLKNDIIPNYVSNVSEETKDEIVNDIYEYIEDYRDYVGIEDMDYYPDSCGIAGTCTYDIKGFHYNGQNVKKNLQISNLKVRLMQCGSPYGNGNYKKAINQPLVDFEDYIAGVVYAEIGDGYPLESIKAFSIMARNFALTRPTSMGNARGLKLNKENGQWILQISSCVADQVFCNVNEGCSYMGGGDGQGGFVASGTNVKGAIRTKPALAQSSKIRKAVSATVGQVAVNSQGYIVGTSYTSKEQNQLKSYGQNGKNYKEILFKMYSSIKDIKKMSCSQEACEMSTGPYAGWKQYGAPWSTIKMGTSGKNIGQIGCLVTSISILIAKSGVQTNVDTFNPGTFVKFLNSHGGFANGGNYIWGSEQKIAPKFKYVNKINVSGMTQTQKLNKIKELQSKGYYMTCEVKGNTGQHWVAVDNVNGNTINMMDPGSKSTNMWKQYSWKNTSTIAYFKVG